jgi:hypothetical protein
VSGGITKSDLRYAQLSSLFCLSLVPPLGPAAFLLALMRAVAGIGDPSRGGADVARTRNIDAGYTILELTELACVRNFAACRLLWVLCESRMQATHTK